MTNNIPPIIPEIKRDTIPPMHLNPIQLIIVQTLTLTITTLAKVLILIIISIQHINTVKGLNNLK